MKENDNMTAERSLEIITDMVRQTRQHVESNAWKSMLYWGIITLIIALAVGHLWAHTSLGPTANVLWLLVIPAAFVPLLRRDKKPKEPTTYLYKAIGKVWAWFGYICCTLGVIYGLMAALHPTISIPGDQDPTVITVAPIVIPVTPIIVLLMGLGSTITGSLLQMRTITVCGFFTAILGGTVGFVVSGPYQMVLLAACVFIALIVPALLIKFTTKPCSSH
jgi:hypothetical protein